MSQKNHPILREWREKIKTANRHNIFCHCHDCGFEWIDSELEVTCIRCGSDRIEAISCWQFPDD